MRQIPQLDNQTRGCRLPKGGTVDMISRTIKSIRDNASFAIVAALVVISFALGFVVYCLSLVGRANYETERKVELS